MTREQLHKGFILHTRPYGDSSLLVDTLTCDFGRLTLVARGQRQAKPKSRKPLQPFTEILFSWSGKGELKTLTAAELHRGFAPLQGNSLYCGFYGNELLLRLLQQHDVSPDIYQLYADFIAALADMGATESAQLEPLLRQFEFSLLDALGYGVNFSHLVNSDQDIQPQGYYRFVADGGFSLVETNAQSSSYFQGDLLLAVAAGNYNELRTRRAAKRLIRLALAPHLGDKPLKSRELFGKSSG